VLGSVIQLAEAVDEHLHERPRAAEVGSRHDDLPARAQPLDRRPEHVLQFGRREVLDHLDDGRHVIVAAVVRQPARRDDEEALRLALVHTARVVDLGPRNVDARRDETVVEQPDQRPGPAAHVEVPVVALHLLDGTPELQVVPLALDAPTAPVDGVVVPARDRLVVEPTIAATVSHRRAHFRRECADEAFAGCVAIGARTGVFRILMRRWRRWRRSRV
jgi:hypothetical protein